MKQKSFSLVLFLLMVLMGQQAYSYDFKVNGIYYSYNTAAGDNIVNVSSSVYHDYQGNVAIPESVHDNNGHTCFVTGVEDGAFSGCTGLVSVTFNTDFIGRIGERAFYGCTSLTSVSLNTRNLYSIGSYAFAGCKKLTTAIFPSSSSEWEISEHMYDGCSSLTDVSIPNKGYTGIGDSAFKGCTSLTSIDIPSNITSIGLNAFYGCTNLSTVNFPNGLNYIGGEAFAECGLTSLVIPDGMSAFDCSDFRNCPLTTLTIGKNVANILGINDYPFDKLTAIIVDDGNITYDSRNNCNAIIKTSTAELIKGCKNTIIPNGVTKIGNASFSYCYGLTSITIPSSVVSIGNYAFSGCYNLTSIRVANGNTVFDSRDDCNAVIETTSNTLVVGCQSTIIPSSVTAIGSRAFYHSLLLTSVTIPLSVTCIGSQAFYGSGLTSSVTIPNSVTKIGSQAFENTAWYDNKPDGMVYVGKVAYEYKGLMPANTSIEIEEGTVSISPSAFRYCSGLTSITIPNSVTEIGSEDDSGVFYGCSNLTSVTSKIKAPFTFGSSAFSGISNTCKLIVPYGTTDAYIAAGWTTSVFKGGIEEADPTELPVTISDAGVATFCSNFDLDFTSSEVKAYIVSTFTPSTGSVTLTRVMDVPAGEGLILKGAAGTYDIPVCTGETVMANMLVGVTTATQLNKVDGDYTNYILARNGASWGFFAVADGSTLAAGKAYLPLPTAKLPSSNVKSLNIVFDDEPVTAVEDIEGVSKEDAQIYYNLNGQRVEKPTRGLYIVGGKKVFVK